MGQMTKAEIEAAMDQITNCVVTVKVPRLTAEEIEELTRSKKRRAKKRYSTLDFSDDRAYFQKACTQDIWYPNPKSRRTYTRKRKKNEKDEPPKKKELPSYLAYSDIDEKPSEWCNPLFNEMGLLRVKEEVDPSSSTFDSQIKLEPREDPPKSTPVWKIRIKSAYELGSNVVFVDTYSGPATSSKVTAYQPALSDLITGEAEPKPTESSNFLSKLNIPTISSLYKEFFTNDNRTIIKKVAEALVTLSENIKKKNDKLTEINCSRSTDAEKLLLRHQAYNEFNRVRDANQIVLKQQFEAIGESLNRENFEILFQLFFLGILKTFIVSVSNKKGTMFKKIVSLLSQSLTSSEYKNERILNLLKSKDFRVNCLALVHFLEKYNETKCFDMLFISDADKKNLLSDKNLGDRADVSDPPSKPSLLSLNAKIPSVVKYSKGMKTLSAGSHLLLLSSFIGSTIQPKLSPLSDLSLKKIKITSALLNSMKTAKFASVNQNVSKVNGVKKPFPQSNFNVATSLSSLAPNYQVSSIPSVCPPPYSVGSSAGTTSFSAINAANTPISSSSIQSMGHLISSNAQPGGGFTHFSTCAQPMGTYSTSTVLTNPSSTALTTFVNSSSSVQSVRTLTNSNPGLQSTVPGNCNQPQQILPASSTAIPISSYQYVIQSSQPSVVHANYTPNVIVTTSRLNNRSRSVIVGAGSPALSASQAIGAPPQYTITSQGIMQSSSPLPQLLPPVIPPLQPQIDAVPPHGMMQSSSPLAQLQPPAVPNLSSQTLVDPLTYRGVMQSSPPLSELLPPVVPDLQTQPDQTVRTYSSAREANKRVQIPSSFDQSGMGSKFHMPGSADNSATDTSMASAESPHHFIIPLSDGNGVASVTIDSSQVNNPFSYRTISPAGNSENIQPHSPQSLLHQNLGDCGTRSVKDSGYAVCPTTSPNDGVTLRTLLMESGRAPLVNQNGPVEAPFQYAEKTNLSLDLPPVMSSDDIANETLVQNHFLMGNYMGSSFSC